MPLVTKRRRQAVRWWAWGLAIAVSGSVLVVVMLPPWVAEHWRILIMVAFDPYCHQIAERSIQIDGIPLAVCHRCIGIYTGLFLGSWVMLATRQIKASAPATVILLSLAPMAVDWGLDVLGLVSNTPASRMITGLAFGIVAGLLVVRGVALYAPRSDASPVVDLIPD